jgi:hypothetical protein
MLFVPLARRRGTRRDARPELACSIICGSIFEYEKNICRDSLGWGDWKMHATARDHSSAPTQKEASYKEFGHQTPFILGIFLGRCHTNVPLRL